MFDFHDQTFVCIYIYIHGLEIPYDSSFEKSPHGQNFGPSKLL